jgi:hypothetical protein
LFLQHRGVLELSLRGHVQKFIVRQSTPEKERQARRQFQIGDSIGGARRDVFRNLFGPVKKLGTGQNQNQRILDSRFEIARFPRFPVKGKRGCKILLRYRPAKRAPRGVRYDLSRAGRFFVRACGTA